MTCPTFWVRYWDKMADRKFTSIDLFAGCGGLSLGLEQAGFRPVLFSEIDEATSESFKYNLGVGNDIEEVRDVKDLLANKKKKLRAFLKRLRKDGVDEIDLVCGGPPCQAYSGIGHRRSYKPSDLRQMPISTLYKDMASVIGHVKPKTFLFENVRALLSKRWSDEGEKGEVFGDVLNCFYSLDGYKIGWQLLYSKNYGVPQNRPRVFIVGIREDIDFFGNYRGPSSVVTTLPGYDKERYPDVADRDKLEHGIEWGLLPEGDGVGSTPDIVEVLGDLVDPDYVNGGETKSYPSSVKSDFQREMRTSPGGKLMNKGSILTEQEYSNHKLRIRNKFNYMIKNKVRSKNQLPPRYQTEKFSQRVLPETWGSGGPSITATSLPDDYVHYCQPRSLTVREWARLQTFPDWTEFHGKRTTGGLRRAGDPNSGIHDREVPKYTQIGNAVPVRLASAIGKQLAKFIR